jgi:hypothetical protein
VVLSHGKTGRGAYPLVGAAVGIACNATNVDGANCDRSDAIFFDTLYNEGTQATTFFDDYIVWGSNLDKRNPTLTVSNACPTTPSNGPLCETWCAPCANNVHGSSTVPSVPTRLCAKFITSSNPCEATCVWPGANLPCP